MKIIIRPFLISALLFRYCILYYHRGRRTSGRVKYCYADVVAVASRRTRLSELFNFSSSSRSPSGLFIFIIFFLYAHTHTHTILRVGNTHTRIKSFCPSVRPCVRACNGCQILSLSLSLSSFPFKTRDRVSSPFIRDAPTAETVDRTHNNIRIIHIIIRRMLDHLYGTVFGHDVFFFNIKIAREPERN